MMPPKPISDNATGQGGVGEAAKQTEQQGNCSTVRPVMSMPWNFEPSPLPPPQEPPPLVPPRLPLPPRLLPRAMGLILPEIIYCPILPSSDGATNCLGAKCAAYRPAHADWGYCKLIDGGAA